MAAVTVMPGLLSGEVTVPPSKSLSHRALIAAFLSGGGEVVNLADNEDISATRDCLAALRGGGEFNGRESGSTLRFLMPLALALNGGGVFTGSPRLLERPLGPYFELFREKNISIAQENGRIVLKGKLPPGRYALPGDVSSQFITGLLFALPLLEGDSEIALTSPLESAPYVDLTLQVLEAFGISVTRNIPPEGKGFADAPRAAKGFYIPGGQRYAACRYTVEGDESAAAFWLAANALGSEINCRGLNPKTMQGDRVIRDFIQNDRYETDARECPDLVPVLAALYCFRKGERVITGAKRLRDKESDRLSAVAAELNRLGGRVTERPDGLVIRGGDALSGGEVFSHNDHRIAMALSIAATRCDGPVILHGAECVAKSYPGFFADFKKLKGKFL